MARAGTAARRGGIAAALLATLAAPLAARDWAIVVGVDDYRHFQPHDPARPVAGHVDLGGAVNDARVIAEALRGVGVDLPDARLLTDQGATLTAFLAAWQAVTTAAAPGDRVFLSFAGHGGQEREVAAPLDEADGMDETLMFHDFDPADPRVGRLTDDQLRALLEGVPQLQVVLVLDSCHSGGLERALTAGAGGLSRAGGKWNVAVAPLPSEPPSGSGDAGAADLPHVTQILATATDDRLVQETAFDGRPHGALSYFFAQGIAGAADMNADGLLTRQELAQFVGDRVFTHMDQNQSPRFLPRGDDAPMLSGAAAPAGPGVVASPPAGGSPVPLAVRVVGAAPPGLAALGPAVVQVQTGAALTFQDMGGRWAVITGNGDQVTQIGADPAAVAAQVARTRFLIGLNAAKPAGLPPVVMTPRQSAARHPVGTRVAFDMPPPGADLAFLTLFNLASDGTVQYGLYPPGFSETAPAAAGLSLQFVVSPPTGEDQLVAIWCRRPPAALHDLLRRGNGRVVPPLADVLGAVAETTCQFGRIGLYTQG